MHGSALRQQFNLVFTLIRSGQFSPDIIETIVNSTIPKLSKKTKATAPTAKEKASKPQSPLLSKLIDMFIEECIPKWTYKSHREFVGHFGVLIKSGVQFRNMKHSSEHNSANGKEFRREALKKAS